MRAYPVSTRVNSPKNDAPKLLANEPLTARSYRRSQGIGRKESVSPAPTLRQYKQSTS
jgi:hypothetical protein